MYDFDDSQTIDFSNLKKASIDLKENLDDDFIRKMIECADYDGDGEVNLEDFMKLMKLAKLY